MRLRCQSLFSPVAVLVAVALSLGGCNSGTWVLVQMTAASGLAPTNMHLTATVTGQAPRQLAIASLPDTVQLLAPDRAVQVTATLTGTLAGVPFTKSGAIETVPHQKRTLTLALDSTVGGAPDLAPPAPDLASPDLNLGPPPPLALVNAMQLPQMAKQVTTTITLGGGELTLLAVYWNENGATVSVSDTANNEWRMGPVYSNALTTCSFNSGTQMQLWYIENSKQGQTTITATGTPGKNPMAAFLLVYTGVALTFAEETRSGATPSMPSNAMELPALNTTGTEDLIVAAFADSQPNGVMQAGNGFRADIIDQGFIGMVEDVVGVAPGMHPVSASLPSGISDGCWVGAAAAFKRR
jgi:hypothetical protein